MRVSSRLPCRRAIQVVFACLFFFVTQRAGFSANIEVGIGLMGGASFSKPVKTVKELQYEGLVIQKLDYSCGSAALATVFVHKLGVEVNEQEIIASILKTADLQKVIERKGFSLLDLKRFAKSRGYRAIGYRLDLVSLAALNGPVLTPITVHGYKHFVIVRGVREGRVFLGDPARGKLTVPVGQFSEFWHTANELGGEGGIGFVVLPSGQVSATGGKLSVEQTDHGYLADQQLRTIVKDRTFFVPPVQGEF